MPIKLEIMNATYRSSQYEKVIFNVFFLKQCKYGFRKSHKLILVIQLVATSAERRSDSILLYVKDSEHYSRLTLGTRKEESDP